ncbi:hypothetical protein PCC7424_1109 [Gloeothece citriformis PCC 7424]|uniref:Uncharacterized protein n=1 Tax=Gloeothece citriformis (strain PCC 7424) TaxID=65393 RepID=B7KJW1_GLOC7|nr:hypothetical protein [Gloeothece citriformis]ACK69560.1 hypothetical protein PCC7424_1109 [Gloeothece citriformis PCC 7424]
MKQLPNEKKQAEIVSNIEIAEEKAIKMANFAISIAKKWEIRLLKTNKEEEIKS